MNLGLIYGSNRRKGEAMFEGEAVLELTQTMHPRGYDVRFDTVL